LSWTPAVAEVEEVEGVPHGGAVGGNVGLTAEAFGFGRLSQLRLESAGSRQLRSMNLAIDVWSA